MEIFSMFFIVVMCAFAYILGVRHKQQDEREECKYVDKQKYSLVHEDQQDEESQFEKIPQPKSTEEQNSQQDILIKDQQKEIDRLIRQLTDFKKREQKHNAEIHYLQTKITFSAVPSRENHKNDPSMELMTDEGFTELLDEASQNLKDQKEIDEDEICKQIDESLL